jgi:hypothetical protein
MGTRSLTFLYDEDGNKIINLYQNMMVIQQVMAGGWQSF